MSDVGAIAGTIVDAEAPPGFIAGRNGGFLKKWQKGQSGNPSGLSNEGAYHEARKICSQYTSDAIAKQIELMNCDDPRVAFIATEAILKRGIGAPRDHSGEKATTVDLSALSDGERQSLAKLLEKALGL